MDAPRAAAGRATPRTAPKTRRTAPKTPRTAPKTPPTAPKTPPTTRATPPTTRATPRTTRATPRTTVRRAPARGVYEEKVIASILDEALVAHLGFVEGGQPYVVPTLHARVHDRVYLHASAAARWARTLAAGAPACLTVTLLDGMVLARSALHHSVNYRSVVVLGTARPVRGAAETAQALEAFTERLIPGRYREVRAPTERELRRVAVLAIALDECSAKVRAGPPRDEPEDYRSDAWAGVVPLRTLAGPPLPDPRLAPGIAPSPAVVRWVLARGAV
jgi:nitroimidazol reductase NimA-like FMN-containing flavoprotein (pyridoxamine 5'-phosphate oxidase superfamily)